MHAIRVSQHGGPEVLQFTELSDPEPGSHQILVDTTAIGVNFKDTYLRTGTYAHSLPFVLGDEGTGVVAAVGDEVREFAVGDRVAWAAAPGSYATRVIVEENNAVAVPEALEPAVAASALLQGMTAHYLLESVYRPQPGETILVHAGAGGVGLLLTQWAARRGIRVITTTSTPEKADLSRAAGAAEVLAYTDDIPARVRAATGGEGAAAVYDGVGAATFDASLASVRVRGALVVFGAASGPVPPLDLQRLNTAGSVWVTRPTLGDFTRTRAELLSRATAVFDAITAGTLDIRIGARYPLAEAAQAHRALEARTTTGSIVLVP